MTKDPTDGSLPKNVCFLEIIQQARIGEEGYDFSRLSSIPFEKRGDDFLHTVQTDSSMEQYIDVDQHSLPHPASEVYQLMLSKLEQDLCKRLRAASEVLEQDEAVFAQEFQVSSPLVTMSGSDSETRGYFGHHVNDIRGMEVASCVAGAQEGCVEYFAAAPDHLRMKRERDCGGFFADKIRKAFDTSRNVPPKTEHTTRDTSGKRKRGRPRKSEASMPEGLVMAGSKETGDLKSDKPKAKAQSVGSLRSIVVQKEDLVRAAKNALIDDGIGGGRLVPLSSVVVQSPQGKDSHLERPKTGKTSVTGKSKKQRGRPPINFFSLSSRCDLSNPKHARQEDGHSPRSDVTHVSPRRL